MRVLTELAPPHTDRHSAMPRPSWVAGACCLLFAVGTHAGQLGRGEFAASSDSLWAAPVDEAPVFAGDTPNLEVILSDALFVAQGWRWSPGSTAWIAVLVRVNALKTVGLARMGGLYGP